MNFKKAINHNGHAAKQIPRDNEHDEDKSLWDSFSVRGWLNAAIENQVFRCARRVRRGWNLGF